MTLYKTKEAYINLVQEGKSYELTLTRIEDKISEMYERYGLDRADDEIVELSHFKQNGYDVVSIGLGDMISAFQYDEVVEFLASLLQIDKFELSELDYLNLRNF